MNRFQCVGQSLWESQSPLELTALAVGRAPNLQVPIVGYNPLVYGR